MSSKGAKLKSRRIKQRQYAGRPAKEGVERYPGGQIRHSERQEEIRSVAVEALDRVHRLPYDKRGYSGYVLGRMHLDGRITECELEAGNEFAERMAKYYSLTGIVPPSPRAQSLFSIKGFDGDISENRAIKARHAAESMMRMDGILMRLPEGPQVKSTLYSVCILDIEQLRTMSDYQLGLLKRGLMALHWHFGLGKEKQHV